MHIDLLRRALLTRRAFAGAGAGGNMLRALVVAPAAMSPSNA